ncbi:hypothetical protein XELAEV_18039755mg [Pelobates cultripes]|uniref:PDZ domain-containing protein n=1 Tax=Pelobates cultripes TaxID=61616 RepID=A0AAD1TJX9_PELCU|nr:hypothetical protein XELAEV_18039755mg [Pelobates cultripes]
MSDSEEPMEVTLSTEAETCASGFTITGGGQEGITVSQVLKESKHSKIFCIKEGDQLLSATIYFDNITYEDATRILQHSEPYRVQFQLKRKLGKEEREKLHSAIQTKKERTNQNNMIEVKRLIIQCRRPTGKFPESDRTVKKREHKKKRSKKDRLSWPKFQSITTPTFSGHRRSCSTSETNEEEAQDTSKMTESYFEEDDIFNAQKDDKQYQWGFSEVEHHSRKKRVGEHMSDVKAKVFSEPYKRIKEKRSLDSSIKVKVDHHDIPKSQIKKGLSLHSAISEKEASKEEKWQDSKIKDRFAGVEVIIVKEKNLPSPCKVSPVPKRDQMIKPEIFKTPIGTTEVKTQMLPQHLETGVQTKLQVDIDVPSSKKELEAKSTYTATSHTDNIAVSENGLRGLHTNLKLNMQDSIGVYTKENVSTSYISLTNTDTVDDYIEKQFIESEKDRLIEMDDGWKVNIPVFQMPPTGISEQDESYRKAVEPSSEGKPADLQPVSGWKLQMPIIKMPKLPKLHRKSVRSEYNNRSTTNLDAPLTGVIAEDQSIVRNKGEVEVDGYKLSSIDSQTTVLKNDSHTFTDDVSSISDLEVSKLKIQKDKDTFTETPSTEGDEHGKEFIMDYEMKSTNVEDRNKEGSYKMPKFKVPSFGSFTTKIDITEDKAGVKTSKEQSNKIVKKSVGKKGKIKLPKIGVSFPKMKIQSGQYNVSKTEQHSSDMKDEVGENQDYSEGLKQTGGYMRLTRSKLKSNYLVGEIQKYTLSSDLSTDISEIMTSTTATIQEPGEAVIRGEEIPVIFPRFRIPKISVVVSEQRKEPTGELDKKTTLEVSSLEVTGNIETIHRIQRETSKQKQDSPFKLPSFKLSSIGLVGLKTKSSQEDASKENKSFAVQVPDADSGNTKEKLKTKLTKKLQDTEGKTDIPLTTQNTLLTFDTKDQITTEKQQAGLFILKKQLPKVKMPKVEIFSPFSTGSIPSRQAEDIGLESDHTSHPVLEGTIDTSVELNAVPPQKNYDEEKPISAKKSSKDENIRNLKPEDLVHDSRDLQSDFATKGLKINMSSNVNLEDIIKDSEDVNEEEEEREFTLIHENGSTKREKTTAESKEKTDTSYSRHGINEAKKELISSKHTTESITKDTERREELMCKFEVEENTEISEQDLRTKTSDKIVDVDLTQKAIQMKLPILKIPQFGTTEMKTDIVAVDTHEVLPETAKEEISKEKTEISTDTSEILQVSTMQITKLTVTEVEGSSVDTEGKIVEEKESEWKMATDKIPLVSRTEEIHISRATDKTVGKEEDLKIEDELIKTDDINEEEVVSKKEGLEVEEEEKEEAEFKSEDTDKLSPTEETAKSKGKGKKHRKKITKIEKTVTRQISPLDETVPAFAEQGISTSEIKIEAEETDSKPLLTEAEVEIITEKQKTETTTTSIITETLEAKVDGEEESHGKSETKADLDISESKKEVIETEGKITISKRVTEFVTETTEESTTKKEEVVEITEIEEESVDKEEEPSAGKMLFPTFKLPQFGTSQIKTDIVAVDTHEVLPETAKEEISKEKTEISTDTSEILQVSTMQITKLTVTEVEGSSVDTEGKIVEEKESEWKMATDKIPLVSRTEEIHISRATDKTVGKEEDLKIEDELIKTEFVSMEKPEEVEFEKQEVTTIVTSVIHTTTTGTTSFVADEEEVVSKKEGLEVEEEEKEEAEFKSEDTDKVSPTEETAKSKGKGKKHRKKITKIEKTVTRQISPLDETVPAFAEQGISTSEIKIEAEETDSKPLLTEAEVEIITEKQKTETTTTSIITETCRVEDSADIVEEIFDAAQVKQDISTVEAKVDGEEESHGKSETKADLDISESKKEVIETEEESTTKKEEVVEITEIEEESVDKEEEPSADKTVGKEEDLKIEDELIKTEFDTDKVSPTEETAKSKGKGKKHRKKITKIEKTVTRQISPLDETVPAFAEQGISTSEIKIEAEETDSKPLLTEAEVEIITEKQKTETTTTSIITETLEAKVDSEEESHGWGISLPSFKLPFFTKSETKADLDISESKKEVIETEEESTTKKEEVVEITEIEEESVDKEEEPSAGKMLFPTFKLPQFGTSQIKTDIVAVDTHEVLPETAKEEISKEKTEISPDTSEILQVSTMQITKLTVTEVEGSSVDTEGKIVEEKESEWKMATDKIPLVSRTEEIHISRATDKTVGKEEDLKIEDELIKTEFVMTSVIHTTTTGTTSFVADEEEVVSKKEGLEVEEEEKEEAEFKSEDTDKVSPTEEAAKSKGKGKKHRKKITKIEKTVTRQISPLDETVPAFAEQGISTSEIKIEAEETDSKPLLTEAEVEIITEKQKTETTTTSIITETCRVEDSADIVEEIFDAAQVKQDISTVEAKVDGEEESHGWGISLPSFKLPFFSKSETKADLDISESKKEVIETEGKITISKRVTEFVTETTEESTTKKEEVVEITEIEEESVDKEEEPSAGKMLFPTFKLPQFGTSQIKTDIVAVDTHEVLPETAKEEISKEKTEISPDTSEILQVSTMQITKLTVTEVEGSSVDTEGKIVEEKESEWKMATDKIPLVSRTEEIHISRATDKTVGKEEDLKIEDELIKTEFVSMEKPEEVEFEKQEVTSIVTSVIHTTTTGTTSFVADEEEVVSKKEGLEVEEEEKEEAEFKSEDTDKLSPTEETAKSKGKGKKHRKKITKIEKTVTRQISPLDETVPAFAEQGISTSEIKIEAEETDSKPLLTEAEVEIITEKQKTETTTTSIITETLEAKVDGEEESHGKSETKADLDISESKKEVIETEGKITISKRVTEFVTETTEESTTKKEEVVEITEIEEESVDKEEEPSAGKMLFPTFKLPQFGTSQIKTDIVAVDTHEVLPETAKEEISKEKTEISTDTSEILQVSTMQITKLTVTEVEGSSVDTEGKIVEEKESEWKMATDKIPLVRTTSFVADEEEVVSKKEGLEVEEEEKEEAEFKSEDTDKLSPTEETAKSKGKGKKHRKKITKIEKTVTRQISPLDETVPAFAEQGISTSEIKIEAEETDSKPLLTEAEVEIITEKQKTETTTTSIITETCRVEDSADIVEEIFDAAQVKQDISTVEAKVDGEEESHGWGISLPSFKLPFFSKSETKADLDISESKKEVIETEGKITISKRVTEFVTETTEESTTKKEEVVEITEIEEESVDKEEEPSAGKMLFPTFKLPQFGTSQIKTDIVAVDTHEVLPETAKEEISKEKTEISPDTSEILQVSTMQITKLTVTEVEGSSVDTEGKIVEEKESEWKMATDKIPLVSRTEEIHISRATDKTVGKEEDLKIEDELIKTEFVSMEKPEEVEFEKQEVTTIVTSVIHTTTTGTTSFVADEEEVVSKKEGLEVEEEEKEEAEFKSEDTDKVSPTEETAKSKGKGKKHRKKITKIEKTVTRQISPLDETVPAFAEQGISTSEIKIEAEETDSKPLLTEAEVEIITEKQKTETTTTSIITETCRVEDSADIVEEIFDAAQVKQDISTVEAKVDGEEESHGWGISLPSFKLPFFSKSETKADLDISESKKEVIETEGKITISKRVTEFVTETTEESTTKKEEVVEITEIEEESVDKEEEPSAGKMLFPTFKLPQFGTSQIKTDIVAVDTHEVLPETAKEEISKEKTEISTDTSEILQVSTMQITKLTVTEVEGSSVDTEGKIVEEKESEWKMATDKIPLVSRTEEIHISRATDKTVGKEEDLKIEDELIKTEFVSMEKPEEVEFEKQEVTSIVTSVIHTTTTGTTSFVADEEEVVSKKEGLEVEEEEKEEAEFKSEDTDKLSPTEETAKSKGKGKKHRKKITKIEKTVTRQISPLDETVPAFAEQGISTSEIKIEAEETDSKPLLTEAEFEIITEKQKTETTTTSMHHIETSTELLDSEKENAVLTEITDTLGNKLFLRSHEYKVIKSTQSMSTQRTGITVLEENINVTDKDSKSHQVDTLFQVEQKTANTAEVVWVDPSLDTTLHTLKDDKQMYYTSSSVSDLKQDDINTGNIPQQPVISVDTKTIRLKHPRLSVSVLEESIHIADDDIKTTAVEQSPGSTIVLESSDTIQNYKLSDIDQLQSPESDTGKIVFSHFSTPKFKIAVREESICIEDVDDTTRKLEFSTAEESVETASFEETETVKRVQDGTESTSWKFSIPAVKMPMLTKSDAIIESSDFDADILSKDGASNKSEAQDTFKTKMDVVQTDEKRKSAFKLPSFKLPSLSLRGKKEKSNDDLDRANEKSDIDLLNKHVVINKETPPTYVSSTDAEVTVNLDQFKMSSRQKQPKADVDMEKEKTHFITKEEQSKFKLPKLEFSKLTVKGSTGSANVRTEPPESRTGESGELQRSTDTHPGGLPPDIFFEGKDVDQYEEEIEIKYPFFKMPAFSIIENKDVTEDMERINDNPEMHLTAIQVDSSSFDTNKGITINTDSAELGESRIKPTRTKFKLPKVKLPVLSFSDPQNDDETFDITAHHEEVDFVLLDYDLTNKEETQAVDISCIANQSVLDDTEKLQTEFNEMSNTNMEVITEVKNVKETEKMDYETKQVNTSPFSKIISKVSDDLSLVQDENIKEVGSKINITIEKTEVKTSTESSSNKSIRDESEITDKVKLSETKVLKYDLPSFVESSQIVVADDLKVEPKGFQLDRHVEKMETDQNVYKSEERSETNRTVAGNVVSFSSEIVKEYEISSSEIKTTKLGFSLFKVKLPEAQSNIDIQDPERQVGFDTCETEDKLIIPEEIGAENSQELVQSTSEASKTIQMVASTAHVPIRKSFTFEVKSSKQKEETHFTLQSKAASISETTDDKDSTVHPEEEVKEQTPTLKSPSRFLSWFPSIGFSTSVDGNETQKDVQEEQSQESKPDKVSSGTKEKTSWFKFPKLAFSSSSDKPKSVDREAELPLEKPKEKSKIVTPTQSGNKDTSESGTSSTDTKPKQ